MCLLGSFLGLPMYFYVLILILKCTPHNIGLVLLHCNPFNILAQRLQQFPEYLAALQSIVSLHIVEDQILVQLNQHLTRHAVLGPAEVVEHKQLGPEPPQVLQRNDLDVVDPAAGMEQAVG